MKLIKLMAITVAVMLCTAQAFAYTFINEWYTAEVSADGHMTYFVLNIEHVDVTKTMEATISYSLAPGGARVSKAIGGDFTNMWTTVTADPTPEGAGDTLEVSSLYRINPRGAGDILDVKVRTKLEDGAKYLAQRYWVEYDENGGLDLFDVNIMVTMTAETIPDTLWADKVTPMGPLASDWGSTSSWPNPVDTAHFEWVPREWRVQGYVPDIPDGAHVVPPDTILMDWNLGNLGNVPAPAIVGALELRTDIVPEPCTMALMGAGLLGLFGARRKRA